MRGKMSGLCGFIEQLAVVWPLIAGVAQNLPVDLGGLVLRVLSSRRRRQVGDAVEPSEKSRPRWNWAGELQTGVNQTRMVLRKEKNHAGSFQEGW